MFCRSGLLKSLAAVAMVLLFAQTLSQQLLFFKDAILQLANSKDSDAIVALSKALINKIYNEKFVLALVYIDSQNK